MENHASRMFFSGRTDRVNQLAHVSLMDGKNNTSVGLNVDHVHGADNTVVGAYAGVLDTASRGVVLIGANVGRRAQRSTDSVAIGWGAMSSALTTDKCVFVGTDTGKHARWATYCTAIGHASGSKLVTALRTTLVGSLAGHFAVNSTDDTFVGYASGMRFRNGGRNTCLGAASAQRLESGSENVLIGHSAGSNIGNAHQVVGIGPYALENADNSSNVIAIGPGAGRNAANAQNSMFIGTEAGTSSDGGFNVYVGPLAGNAGSFNTMVGYGTGARALGNNNTYLGYATGNAASGSDNTLLGHAAGDAVLGSQNVMVGAGSKVDGDNNVCVGFESGNTVTMVSNSTFIGAGSGCDGDNNTVLGKNAGFQGVGGNNAVIGFQTGQYLLGNNNVIAGIGSANHLKAQNSVVVGPKLFVHDPNSQSINLLNSVAIGTAIRSTASTSVMSNSVILGSSITAAGDLVNSVVLGSGISLSSTGQDSNKCIIGIEGLRAIEATAYSLRLGGSTNTFLEADVSSFVLGPTNRPHMQVNRQPEGSLWNNSKTCFPASPTSMLRSLGYVGDTLVRCDSVPGLRPRGSATPNLVNARPYSSEASNRLPTDGDTSWFGVPVFINAMGDLRYINLSFRDELSKCPFVDAIGQTLSGGSFSVEMWVWAGGGLNSSGPVFGSMNSDPVTLGGNVTDWALGISYFNAAGVGNGDTRFPMFMYSLPDGSGWIKLMANIPSILGGTWYHIAVIGEAGKLYMFVDGVRVEMFQVSFTYNFNFVGGYWDELYTTTGTFSNVHTIPSAGFTSAGVRTGFAGAGLRVGRMYIPESGGYPNPAYYPACITALVTEIMYRSPRLTEVGYANNIGGFPKPTSARAVPPKNGMGATVYITPVGETPVLGSNDFAELHGVRAGGFELWPYTRPSDKGNWWQSWVGENWFPMPRTMPDSSIRVHGGGCIHMQKMPIYLEVSGNHGISTNGSGVFSGVPAGTVIWGEDGSIVCANPGKTAMVNIQKVMTWNRTGVSIARNTAVEGTMTISGNLSVTGSVTGNFPGAANFDNAGNLTLGGILKTSKTSIATGFAGGPRITQAVWDAPGPTHVLDMNVLMASCDNVSGMLYLHVSSKSNDNKNGMATLGIIKSSGYAPIVTVFTSQRSANLSTFTISSDVQNINLIVSTDATCAICWTFVSGA